MRHHLITIWFLALAAVSFSASAETQLQRGKYLMEAVAACGNCHTPQGPKGPVAEKTLAGGLPFEEGAFKVYASNITPHKKTGIGRWTDSQLITAIREGRRPNGTLIAPVMPFETYRGLSDSDVKAIVAYLRTVKPVKNAVPKAEMRNVKLPPAYGPPVGTVADVPRSDKVAYGAYIAGPLAHCTVCHSTPVPGSGPDLKNQLGAGGMKFPGPWGESVATNITPSNLERYSDADLKRVITSGVRPDGSRLKPPMGVSYYAKMSEADQDALVAYLRQLPKK